MPPERGYVNPNWIHPQYQWRLLFTNYNQKVHDDEVPYSIKFLSICLLARLCKVRNFKISLNKFSYWLIQQCQLRGGGRKWNKLYIGFLLKFHGLNITVIRDRYEQNKRKSKRNCRERRGAMLAVDLSRWPRQVVEPHHQKRMDSSSPFLSEIASF